MADDDDKELNPDAIDNLLDETDEDEVEIEGESEEEAV